jgi:formylglycine-generating enzyme required for sulfatase activity
LTPDGEKAQAARRKSEFKECAAGCPTMVVLPADTFMMGSPGDEKDHDNSEGPQHQVTIATPFAVSKTKVTFAEWDTCVAAGSCRKIYNEWGGSDVPVVSVGWKDAKDYVGWLSRITGKQYRLLTEAEWEYAARAGTQTRFSFGDDETQLDRFAWYIGNSQKTTHPVAMKEPNRFGLYDMHGNAYEWVEDPWHDNYQGAPADGSAWTNGRDPNQRVVRGSSWGGSPKNSRVARRRMDGISVTDNDRGFRVARTLNP